MSDIPDANFSFDNNNGCDSMYVQINNLSSTDVIRWDWDFGDSFTSTENSPSHYYENNGIYEVKLIAYNEACSDTSVKSTIANSEGGHIIIPNTFTPNTNNKNSDFTKDNGVNDIFTL